MAQSMQKGKHKVFHKNMTLNVCATTATWRLAHENNTYIFNAPHMKSVTNVFMRIVGFFPLKEENYFSFRYGLDWDARFQSNGHFIGMMSSKMNSEFLRAEDEKIAQRCAVVWKLLRCKFGQLAADSILAHYLCLTLSKERLHMIFYRKELSWHCKKVIAGTIDKTCLLIPILFDFGDPEKHLTDCLHCNHSSPDRTFEVDFYTNDVFFKSIDQRSHIELSLDLNTIVPPRRNCGQVQTVLSCKKSRINLNFCVGDVFIFQEPYSSSMLVYGCGKNFECKYKKVREKVYKITLPPCEKRNIDISENLDVDGEDLVYFYMRKSIYINGVLIDRNY